MAVAECSVRGSRMSPRTSTRDHVYEPVCSEHTSASCSAELCPAITTISSPTIVALCPYRLAGGSPEVSGWRHVNSRSGWSTSSACRSFTSPTFSAYPPKTSASLPVKTAVCCTRGLGAVPLGAYESHSSLAQSHDHTSSLKPFFCPPKTKISFSTAHDACANRGPMVNFCAVLDHGSMLAAQRRPA